MKARHLERWAFALGALLLLVWGGARLHSVLGAKRELRRFEAARQRAVPIPTVALSQPLAPSRTPVVSAPPAPSAAAVPLPETAARVATLAEPQTFDFQLWSPERIRAYEASRQEQGCAPLAVLRIPAIGLEVAVLDGTDDLTLNRAVGWIAGTARPGEPGNLGIAGHRDGFFRGLKDLTPGGELELETLEGARLVYTVRDIWIVRPDAVGVLDPTPEPSVTLVTCYPFYYVGSAPERYIVRAVLGPAPPAAAP